MRHQEAKKKVALGATIFPNKEIVTFFIFSFYFYRRKCHRLKNKWPKTGEKITSERTLGFYLL